MNEEKIKSLQYRVLKGGLTCKKVNPHKKPEGFTGGTPSTPWNDFENTPNPELPITRQIEEDVIFEGEEVWQYWYNREIWETCVDKEQAEYLMYRRGQTIRQAIEPQTLQEAKTNGEGWLNEYIICSAILINDGIKHEHQPKNIESGFVVSGRRHHNCYSTLAAIAESAGLDTQIKNLIEKTGRDEQGFITNTHRFVDRKEGYLIAQKANQIVFGAGLTDKENQILISENLY